MKYKVGDKFLQEIEVARVNENDPLNCPYMMEPGEKRWNEEELEKLRRPEDMTADEVWKLADKIMEMPRGELAEIFPECEWMYVARNFSPKETKDRIEAREAEKEIKVGDVVGYYDNPKIKVMITKCHHDGGSYDGVNPSGVVYCGIEEKYWKKTGQHIDIQSVLEQIGAE